MGRSYNTGHNDWFTDLSWRAPGAKAKKRDWGRVRVLVKMWKCEKVFLTQQVWNQARLESEQESDSVKKMLSWNKRLSALQVRVKKEQQEGLYLQLLPTQCINRRWKKCNGFYNLARVCKSLKSVWSRDYENRLSFECTQQA